MSKKYTNTANYDIILHINIRDFIKIQKGIKYIGGVWRFLNEFKGSGM